MLCLGNFNSKMRNLQINIFFFLESVSILGYQVQGATEIVFPSCLVGQAVSETICSNTESISPKLLISLSWYKSVFCNTQVHNTILDLGLSRTLALMGKWDEGIDDFLLALGKHAPGFVAPRIGIQNRLVCNSALCILMSYWWLENNSALCNSVYNDTLLVQLQIIFTPR